MRSCPTGTLSARFWQQFVKRNKELLEVGKGSRVANDRIEWVTYENIDQMYDLAYNQMIRSGVAKYLSPENYAYVN